MTPRRCLVETFNTHRMSDVAVEKLACGRDAEMAEIMPAIRRATETPEAPPPALIVYGERGSGKSFLLRMVQIECASIEGLFCVLLPEEQYNLRAPQQLLQVVTAHLREQDWTTQGWRIPFGQIDETAWDEALKDFHAAMDARFGPGLGMAVVLLENFDIVVENLFSAKPTPKTSVRKAALVRRQAEERLRKLMNARGGRYMLVASATGTVDMDYERPLFKAFHPVDLQGWSTETAIEYFNKRRDLDGLPALTPVEQARAQAIVQFIGGNPRLAQLLGSVLSTPNAQTIAQTLDSLVDHLADYYRQRMDSLPLAAASVLDEMIRGGEPVSQTALGQRMGGEQRHIADAFRYLVRSRVVQGSSVGSGSLFRVRDRLFVHFYRRRYGNSQGLAAIAELLERFFTPEEREQKIRHHLETGNYEAARAFGRLPLADGAPNYGYNLFREEGISDGPAHSAFSLAGVAEAEVEPLRQELRDHPQCAFKRWRERVRNTPQPLQAAAAGALAAIAASREGLDRIAAKELSESLAAARASGDADALIVTLVATSIFEWYCHGEQRGGEAKSKEYLAEVGGLMARATLPETKARAAYGGAFAALHQEKFEQAQKSSLAGLALNPSPGLRLSLLDALAHSQISLEQYEEAIATSRKLQAFAEQHRSLLFQIVAYRHLAELQDKLQLPEEALEFYRKAATLADRLGNRFKQVQLMGSIGWHQRQLKQLDEALATGRELTALALELTPPMWEDAASGVLLQARVLGDQNASINAERAAFLLQQAAEYADHTENHGLFDEIVGEWIWVGHLVSQPPALTAIGQALDRQPDLEVVDRTDWNVPENWPWAVSKAHAWAEAATLARRYPELLQLTPEGSWRAAINIAAQTWAETAKKEGRAAAYGLAGKALPAMWALWELRAKQSEKGTDPSSLAKEDLNRMISVFVKDIRDPGLLRDLANLAEHVCGSAAEAATTQLRAFADFHEAKDKPAHLQQIDPDLAIAIRIILDLPEPSEAAATKKRKRAR